MALSGVLDFFAFALNTSFDALKRLTKAPTI